MRLGGIYHVSMSISLMSFPRATGSFPWRTCLLDADRGVFLGWWVLLDWRLRSDGAPNARLQVLVPTAAAVGVLGNEAMDGEVSTWRYHRMDGGADRTVR